MEFRGLGGKWYRCGKVWWFFKWLSMILLYGLVILFLGTFLRELRILVYVRFYIGMFMVVFFYDN